MTMPDSTDRQRHGIILLILLTILLWLHIPVRLNAQLHFSGNTYSSLYVFETPTTYQGNFYQGLRLRFNLASHPLAHVSTSMRVAKTGDSDWDGRLYNLYADWRSAGRGFQTRIGRQFLYDGVINGTLDGALVSLNPADNATVKVFAGLEATSDRSFGLVESDSNAAGAYLAYRFPKNVNANVSYFQRQRNEELVWQVAGSNLHGVIGSNFFYQGQYNYNMKAEELLGARLRLSYFYNDWSFSGEASRQNPRIQEDSYFRIFSIEAFNQYRAGVTLQHHGMQYGAQYLFTDYYIDESNQLILSAGSGWGLVGMVYQYGYAGENFGFYGDVRYDLHPKLTLKAYSSFYQYERQTTDISEDATSYSAGFEYRPFKPLSLQAEVQEQVNSAYRNDLRGRFRLDYTFRR